MHDSIEESIDDPRYYVVTGMKYFHFRKFQHTRIM